MYFLYFNMSRTTRIYVKAKSFVQGNLLEKKSYLKVNIRK